MKKTGTLLLFLLPLFGTLAQNNLNNLGFPSPNNSFLNAVGGATGVGVELYTGAAQVNIPICNLASKELSIPVSLSYIGGRGIRVQDYATSTGLGWQLNAGGSISRVVRGFPDEFSNGYLGTGQWGKKIKQKYADGISWSTADSKAITGWDGTSYTGVTADGEPDLYYIKTPFFSCQFTFNENGVPVFSNETGIKIVSSSFFNTSSYESSTFTVTDPTGNSYSFGAYKDKTIATLYGTSYTFTTTWYLTNISTFNSKDNINFIYGTSSANDVLPHYQWTRNYSSGCQNDNSDPVPMTIVQPKYLATIDCPNGKVDFSYVFDRKDITNSARLSAITLKAKGVMGETTMKTFGFNYSYFGDPSTDKNLLRLKLNNITIAGGTVGTSTAITYRQFFYNISQNLPARNSQSFDYWGYYKSFAGLPVTDPLVDPTIRTANEVNAQANMLTGISELGGASWDLFYESNTYKNASNVNITIGGLRVKKISRALSVTEKLETVYQYNDDLGKSTGQILTEAYPYLVINGFGPGCVVYGQKVLSESPVNIYDLNGAFNGYSSVKTVLPNGGYSISAFQNFSDFNDILTTAASCDGLTFQTLSPSISFAYKRGLLKSVTTYNASNAKISEDVNTYSTLNSPVSKSAWAFRSFVASTACSSGGGGTSTLRDLSSAYYTNIENYRITASVHKDYDQITPANFVQSTTNLTYCTNKRTVQSISTTDSKNNTVTKTMYHAHDSGIPMVTTAETNAHSAMQTLNNLDAVVHETNSKNGAITQTHNIYSNTLGGSTKPFVVGVSSYKGSTLLTTRNILYDVDYANMVSGNTTGGKSSSVLYGYNNAYPVANISNAGAFYTTSQGTGSLSNNFIGSYSINFTVDYAGTIGWSIYPASSLSSNATISFTLTGPSNKSGSGCIGSCASYYSVSYAAMPAGSYTLVITASGPTGANFFCSGSYPKNYAVLNREYFFEGFEENYSSTSGSAHTGNKYWSSGSYNVTYALPNARSYVIQWWNWSGGKWIFNEQPYTGPRMISGIIDDIRIFPSDAQISSVTYDPQVGKTGEIDPSGRTVTYEYDGLARVNIVRDNEKNILSKNCYTYSGQSVACPAATVYTNSIKSQTFTRNNCAAGYLGTQVTYTVAAGTYTSSINAIDADQQALNDITLNGQNYANNNGSCYQIWYNVEKSGSFTRNNCGTGSTGSTVTYTVAAGTYSSTISQADADQQAQNNVNANGQSYANANGTCSAVACSFAMASGYSSPTSGISASGGTVSFYLVFYPTGTMYAGSSYSIATINGGCRPSSLRTVNVTTGGRTWMLNFYSNGQVSATITSGSNVTSGTTIAFSSVTFPL
ncbi:MAG: hypothetical protein IT249_18540 [Chitinophagaceae bacterium]|nr:hypothetical protein [Chitinophagaceae bacterium]